MCDVSCSSAGGSRSVSGCANHNRNRMPFGLTLHCGYTASEADGGGRGLVAFPVFKTAWTSVIPASVGSTPMRPRHQAHISRSTGRVRQVGPPARLWEISSPVYCLLYTSDAA